MARIPKARFVIQDIGDNISELRTHFFLDYGISLFVEIAFFSFPVVQKQKLCLESTDLHIKWSLRVKLKVLSKGTKLPVRHGGVPAFAYGVGNQLDDSRRNSDGGSTQGQQDVACRHDGTGDEADTPSPDGVDRHIGIIKGLHRNADFGIWRVFLEKGCLDCCFFLDITTA